LQTEWNTAYQAHAYHDQTTIDALFRIVQNYKTLSEIAEDYVIDLSSNDREILSEFSSSFRESAQSYKKKHWFWLISPAYYFRKQKAARAKKLQALFGHIEVAASNVLYLRIS